MIKIIGQDSSVVKRVTCHNCSTILEYTLSDERQDYTTDYTGAGTITATYLVRAVVNKWLRKGIDYV